jgi:hypothetical protein
MIDFKDRAVIAALHDAGWIKPPKDHVLIESSMLKRLALQIALREDVDWAKDYLMARGGKVS